MSGTLPTTPAPRKITLQSFEPVYASTAHNLRKITRSRGVHRWTVQLDYPQMQRATFAPLWAFLVSQGGQDGIFSAVLPGLSTPLGDPHGDAVTVGAATLAGVTSIPLTGYTASTVGAVKAGDMLRFGGHSKVYMSVSDADSDAGGNLSCAIRPRLIEPLAAGEAVTWRNVPFSLGLTDDALELVQNLAMIYDGISINLVERV